ncbi:sodium-coupled neutral amino acid transporter 1 [Vombatus ursinus]|uniref:sodium-coupled neutral amino acid transporter 1 n=1 Tax=Vombatus ursinus TaxID=29139 RepID=UPI000FFD8CF8|nr:sodium-coupled neutral amino acid transporter 1 [Vombatus ursinus]
MYPNLQEGSKQHNTGSAKEITSLVVQETCALRTDRLTTQGAMTPGNVLAAPLLWCPQTPSALHRDQEVQQEERDQLKVQQLGIQGTASMSLSIFNLANSIVGSGILGLSYALANTGLIPFLFLFILVTILTGYSINLMLACSEKTGCLNFEKMGEKIYSIKGKYIIFGTTFLQNMGAILSYLFIIKSELPGVIKVLIGKEEEFPIWYLDGRILIILITIAIIFPLCLMKHLGIIGYTSGLSLTCMLFFLIVIIYEKFKLSCPMPGIDESTLSNATIKEMCTSRYIVLNFKSVYALPTIAFAYVCHQAVLPVYKDLKERSLKNMKIVTNVSILSMCFLYLMTAFFGYLTFYGKVHSSLLHKYPDDDILILIVRLSVMMAVTLTIPVLFLTSRESLAELLKKAYFNLGERIVIAVVILGLVDLLVICVPTMKDIFGVLGTTTANMLIFIIPTILFLKITSQDSDKKNERLGAMSLLGLGIIFSTISIPLVIYDWATSADLPETG